MQRVFVKGIKGGVGTTSVVANLVSVLKKLSINIIAIDLDAKSDLGLHLGLPWKVTSGWSNTTAFTDTLTMFYQSSDGVKFLPHGDGYTSTEAVIQTVTDCQQLFDEPDSWLVFDCPAHIDISHYKLMKDDIVIELVNCDAICHSLMFKRLNTLNSLTDNWQHYFLVNKYNCAVTFEFDLYSLWQSTMPLMAPLFINSDEVIKESVAYRNVTTHCAPHSIANDDFETLAGWLASKVAL